MPSQHPRKMRRFRPRKSPALTSSSAGMIFVTTIFRDSTNCCELRRFLKFRQKRTSAATNPNQTKSEEHRERVPTEGPFVPRLSPPQAMRCSQDFANSLLSDRNFLRLF